MPYALPPERVDDVYDAGSEGANAREIDVNACGGCATPPLKRSFDNASRDHRVQILSRSIQ